MKVTNNENNKFSHFIENLQNNYSSDLFFHRSRCRRRRIRFCRLTNLLGHYRSGSSDTLIANNFERRWKNYTKIWWRRRHIKNFEDFVSQTHTRHQRLVDKKSWYGGLPEMGQVWCWWLWRLKRRSCPELKEKATDEEGFTNIYIINL